MNNLKYITLSELIYSVKDDLPSIKDGTFIDEGRLIKVILLCNAKLGITIRKVSETVLKVKNFETDLPNNFDKSIFVAALHTSSFGLSQYTDPYDNFVDLADKDSIKIVSYTEACTTDTRPVIKRKQRDGLWHSYTHWTPLSLSSSSYVHTISDCVNNRVHGKYIVDITDGKIKTPFREADLYMMYYSNLEDEDGNILVPFHPKITPYYEWCVKEKILEDMFMNSDADVSNKLKFASNKKAMAYLDAWDIALEPTFGELHRMEKKKEMELWKRYFQYIK